MFRPRLQSMYALNFVKIGQKLYAKHADFLM